MNKDTYIPRHIESLVLRSLDTFPSIIVTGPRQAGKTTLLKHVLPSSYSYVSLDDLLTRQQAQDDPVLFFRDHSDKLFIDEVQYAPQLFSQMKINIDSQQTLGLYALSGSQKYALMKGVSESLAGRIAILELQGYSLRELLGKMFYEPFMPTDTYLVTRQTFERQHKQTEKGEAREKPFDLWHHIHHGMLPRMQNSELDWEQYYSAYVQTYIERDVRQLAQVGDELQFRQFLVAMAVRSGELLNYSNVARDVGISVDTAKRWASILRASGIAELLQPYSNNVLSRAIKTPKLYFLDTGLVCYLSGWMTPEVLKRGAKAGSIFESFVFSEILKSWLNVGKDPQRLYFYRDKQGNEIDLVINEDGVLYPIEIKMTASPNIAMAKSFRVLESIPGLKRGKGAIICQREEPLSLAEDLTCLPVSFL